MKTSRSAQEFTDESDDRLLQLCSVSRVESYSAVDVHLRSVQRRGEERSQTERPRDETRRVESSRRGALEKVKVYYTTGPRRHKISRSLYRDGTGREAKGPNSENRFDCCTSPPLMSAQLDNVSCRAVPCLTACFFSSLLYSSKSFLSVFSNTFLRAHFTQLELEFRSPGTRNGDKLQVHRSAYNEFLLLLLPAGVLWITVQKKEVKRPEVKTRSTQQSEMGFTTF